MYCFPLDDRIIRHEDTLNNRFTAPVSSPVESLDLIPPDWLTTVPVNAASFSIPGLSICPATLVRVKSNLAAVRLTDYGYTEI